MKNLLIILGLLITTITFGQENIVKPHKPSNEHNSTLVTGIAYYKYTKSGVSIKIGRSGMYLSFIGRDLDELINVFAKADTILIIVLKNEISTVFSRELGVINGITFTYEHMKFDCGILTLNDMQICQRSNKYSRAEEKGYYNDNINFSNYVIDKREDYLKSYEEYLVKKKEYDEKMNAFKVN